MTRRLLTFACDGSQLTASLDEGDNSVGLLIVSGGNELRSGAFAGQSRFAVDIAASGYPVFRFDRRGVGDSEGANLGFQQSALDVAAAISTFRQQAPSLQRIVAFGNCDAASALMLQGGSRADALILSNPWTFDEVGSSPDAMPADAVRARYWEKLRNPTEIKRLLSGGVSFTKLFQGLRQATASAEETGLAKQIRENLAGFGGEVRFLIAERDRTARAFLSHWNSNDARLRRCANATHAYVEPEAFAWLKEQVLEVLAEEEAR